MFAFQEKQLALSDLKPWAYLIDKGIVLNKNGSLTTGFVYRGEDIANLTEQQSIDISLIVNQALKMFDTGYVLHADLIRRSANLDLSKNINYFNNDVASLIEQERIQQFSSKHYYNSDYVITITYLPSISQKNRFAEKFFDEEDNSEYVTSIDLILQNFKSKLDEFENLMSS